MLEAELWIRCSHLLASWVRADDLGAMLRQALDGGQSLRADLWRPVRVPTWHPSMAAAEMELKPREVWSGKVEDIGPLVRTARLVRH